MTPTIQTTDLCKDYKGVRGLVDFSVTIESGLIGLLGPNGAGKSTFIKTLLGLIPPSSGSATVLGHDITISPVEIRRRIGYMPEHECLPSEIPGIEFVTKMGVYAGMRRSDAIRRAHEVLHYLGMGDERYRKISEYSGGMRQKTKLAQALVHDPELLFLDEPTSYLDPDARLELLKTVKEVGTRWNKTIIVSTHILPDVEMICDSVVMVAEGRLLMHGDLKRLLAGSQSSILVRLSGADPRTDDVRFIAKLKELGIVGEQAKEAIRVTKRGEETQDLIIQAAIKADVGIRYMNPETKSLDDLYLLTMDEEEERSSRNASMSGEPIKEVA